MEDLSKRYEQMLNNPIDSYKTNYQCLKCNDTGWVDVIENGHLGVTRCSCFIAKENKRIMEQSGISLEFQTKNFENFNTKNNPQLVIAKNKAIVYSENFLKFEHTRYNSILLCGQVGAGKTHLGVSICNRLISQNIRVVYMAYRNVITRFKQKIMDDVYYDRELNRYAAARVLYIDDLFKGKITESDINIMYEIINYRYINRLPVIISTELILKDLDECDEAISSRIMEMCRGNVISLKEKELNYRLYS